MHCKHHPTKDMLGFSVLDDASLPFPNFRTETMVNKWCQRGQIYPHKTRESFGSNSRYKSTELSTTSW